MAVWTVVALAVRAVPALLASVDPAPLVRAVVRDVLDDGGTHHLEAAAHTLLGNIACRSAIRNGMPLSLPEMQALLDRWKVTRQPRTCPHGRPIYLSLEESALARFFRRHWVIGKSHGLSP